MGREVRMVRTDWEPHDEPLHDGLKFPERLARWIAGERLFKEGKYRGYVSEEVEDLPDYAQGLSYEEWEGERPDPKNFTDTRPGDELTHIVMYENTSEGTPISPKFPMTPQGEEDLARWLADNNASAFGYDGATYEQWLGMIRNGGYSLGMVTVDGQIMSGVAFERYGEEE